MVRPEACPRWKACLKAIGNGLEKTAPECAPVISGKQTGDWTTYDKKGEVYKVTKMC